MNCGKVGETELHHYNGDRKFHFSFGRGSKVPDFMVAELCRKCHNDVHQTIDDRVADSEQQFFLIMKTMFRNEK